MFWRCKPQSGSKSWHWVTVHHCSPLPPKQPQECHETSHAHSFCGTDLLERKKYCTFTHSALLWKKRIETGEGCCSTGIVQVCMVSLFLIEAVLLGSVSCGGILQSPNTTTSCEHRVCSLAGCYSTSRAVALRLLCQQSMYSSRHRYMGAFPTGRSAWLGRGSLPASLGTLPALCCCCSRQDGHGRPPPHFIINFLCQAMPGDGSWAAPQWVCDGSRAVLNCSPWYHYLLSEGKQKAALRVFCMSFPSVDEIVITLHLFLTKGNYILAQAERIPESPILKNTGCKNPNAETHWSLPQADLNAIDFKDCTLKCIIENCCKRKIIDHPMNTGVDRNKSLFMQKPLSLSDLILMAILS